VLFTQPLTTSGHALAPWDSYHRVASRAQADDTQLNSTSVPHRSLQAIVMGQTTKSVDSIFTAQRTRRASSGIG